MLGSNGAGKTTLFNAVTGDFPPSSGRRPSLFGEDVTWYPPVHERIRRGLRRTYQISLLFGGLSVHRERLPRVPRRRARALLAAAPPTADDGARGDRRSIPCWTRCISTGVRDTAGGGAEPRRAAPARGRAGARRARHALHPVRRAGGRALALRTRGAGGDPAARCRFAHRLHRHRARHGRRAAGGRAGVDDAQRAHLQGGHARPRSRPIPQVQELYLGGGHG